MKTKIFIFLILTTKLFSQNTLQDSLKYKIKIENQEIKSNKTLDKFLEKNEYTILTSKETTELFFKKIINTYLSEISDLSFSKAYIVLDNSNDKLFIGGTYDLESNKTDRKFLMTLGVNANIAKGYSSLLKKGEINNDIGITTKLIYYNGGYIWHNINNKNQIENIENKRKHLYLNLLSKYDNELTQFKKSNVLGDSTENQKEFISNFESKMENEFIESEANYIINSKNYNEASLFWATFESYIPISKSEYSIAPTPQFSAIDQKIYRPFKFSTTLNYWLLVPKYRKVSTRFFMNRIFKGSHLFSFKGDLILNNSVMANNIMQYNFGDYEQEINLANNIIYLIKTNSRDVYVGEFKTFWTPKISLKYVVMFPFNFGANAGFRFSFEKSFGNVNWLNWKFGVPFSFKDNNGTPKVNFEISVQEIMKNHSFGISIGLPIKNF